MKDDEKEVKFRVFFKKKKRHLISKVVGNGNLKINRPAQ